MKTYMTLRAKEDQERDEYRARAEAAEAEVARLKAALETTQRDLPLVLESSAAYDRIMVAVSAACRGRC